MNQDGCECSCLLCSALLLSFNILPDLPIHRTLSVCGQPLVVSELIESLGCHSLTSEWMLWMLNPTSYTLINCLLSSSSLFHNLRSVRLSHNYIPFLSSCRSIWFSQVPTNRSASLLCHCLLDFFS